MSTHFGFRGTGFGVTHLDESPLVPEERFPADPPSFETHLDSNQGQCTELDGSVDLEGGQKAWVRY